MSKYKLGDKFIIEIEHKRGVKYFIKGFRNIAFSDYGLDRLERSDADANDIESE